MADVYYADAWPPDDDETSWNPPDDQDQPDDADQPQPQYAALQQPPPYALSPAAYRPAPAPPPPAVPAAFDPWLTPTAATPYWQRAAPADDEVSGPQPQPQQQMAAAQPRQPADDSVYVTDPDLLKQLGVPTHAADGAEYVTDPGLLAALGTPEQPGPDESPLMTFGRRLAHGIGPALAGAATGLGTGAAIGTALEPGLGTIGGGIVGGIGGLIAGGIGAYATGTAQEAGLKALGVDDSAAMAAGAAENPWAARVGDIAPAVVPFGVGRGAVSLGARALYGGIAGATETGTELARGENLDPASIGLNVLAGGALARPRSLLAPFEAQGAKVGASFAGRQGAAPPPQGAAPPGARSGMPDTGGVARTAVPPVADESLVGDPQNKPVRSATEYPTTTGARAPAAGGPGVDVSGTDPTIAAAMAAGGPQAQGTFTVTDPVFNRGGTADVTAHRNPVTGTIDFITAGGRVHIVPAVYRDLPIPEVVARMVGSYPYRVNPDLSQVQPRIAEPPPGQPVGDTYTIADPLGAGPGEQPAGASGIERLRPAYEAIRQEQSGIGTVYISDLVARSGLPLEQVHDIIANAARNGEASINRSSVPEGRLTPDQRAGALRIPGEEPFHTVTFKAQPAAAEPAPGTMAAARRMEPDDVLRGPEPAAAARAPGPGRVLTHDGSIFFGADEHEAAARARMGGYQPHQIFNADGTPYVARQPVAGVEGPHAGEPAAAPEPEGVPGALGAAATGGIPPAPPPPPPPGRFIGAIRAATARLFDFGRAIGRDVRMKAAPMAAGTRDSMAAAKDFANVMRGIDYDWSIADRKIERNFTPEQRKAIWAAMDDESVMRQRGETSPHIGIATLTPEERALADSFQPQAQARWAGMRQLGMVQGEGLPYWTPRMLAGGVEKGAAPRPLDAIGANLATTTGSLRRRKYQFAEDTEAAMKRQFGEQAGIARDVRVMPLALARLDKAIAGRELISNIRAIGRRTGQATVVEGSKPSDPAHTWFTIDHPAFYTTRPRMEEADTAAYRAAVKRIGGIDVPPAMIPLMDRNGDPVIDRVPLYVRGDFEGPLRAVLTKPPGMLYASLMSLKGKTMGLIMNSPLIHNAVEWGRALPAMPGKVATFRVYFEGNRAKNDPATMREAIGNGLVPIGKRFFNQDINAIMEQPNLTPGRSWTSQVLGFVRGLFDPAKGDDVRRGIDRVGDFWHNTLLWDRVGDLQMGLYVNFRDDLTAKNVDPQTAARVAAHWANRYAGALPQEAMSDGARRWANILLFSRSFTLGNLGAMKDMFNGMPRDVRAQIERDVGSLDPNAVGYIKSKAQRKAIGIVMADMAMMYIGNSLLQSGLNVMRGDRTLDQETQGYTDRLAAALKRVREDPTALLQPLDLVQSLSSTAANEPGKQDRIFAGYTKNGTAIYARSPIGKIGEEFVGWPTGPLDMIKRKLGTIARPGWQILANDKGFGRKVYDPNADTPAKYLKNMGLIVQHIVGSQLPEGQLQAAYDLATGQGDPKLNRLQAFGPFTGVTFSRGAPGGPAMGEIYRGKEQQQYRVNEAMPEIRRMIQRGEVPQAMKRMFDLGIPEGLRSWFIRTTINPASRLSPRAREDFFRYATPAQRDRFLRDLQQQQQ